MSMLFAQLTHAIGLNDVCDALRLHSGPLSALRGATAPSRNNLSHANKRRDAALAERLFWTVLKHLQKHSPGFAAGRRGKGLARRFRRVIHVVDSSTIALIASCIDWAQHRRRKAAAKLHVRLDLHSLLPRFVLIESAKAADSIRAAEVCAGVKPGEIVIFDRAYVDFIHLGVLNADGVFWVTRNKESLCFWVVKKLPKATDKRILSDELVVLKNKDSRANYPEAMRRVRALVEIDGKEREMEFLTKQIKQSLQLCDFLGNSANAVRWQVWTALLLYVLMRFLCVISRWNRSFTRLFTLLRAALWRKIDLWDLLRFCGTAGGHFRYLGIPQNAYLPGFAQ